MPSTGGHGTDERRRNEWQRFEDAARDSKPRERDAAGQHGHTGGAADADAMASDWTWDVSADEPAPAPGSVREQEMQLAVETQQLFKQAGYRKALVHLASQHVSCGCPALPMQCTLRLPPLA